MEPTMQDIIDAMGDVQLTDDEREVMGYPSQQED
jgi:hypothetical protein